MIKLYNCIKLEEKEKNKTIVQQYLYAQLKKIEIKKIYRYLSVPISTIKWHFSRALQHSILEFDFFYKKILSEKMFDNFLNNIIFIEQPIFWFAPLKQRDNWKYNF